MPEQVCIRGQEIDDTIINGYNKFYLPGKSSRGVALTVSQDSYDVELNIGASTADYILATKIAIVLAELNDTTISTEADDELSIDEFKSIYNENWASDYRLHSVSAVLQHFATQHQVAKLPSCVRSFYFGPYMLDKLTADSPSEESFVDKVIESIRRVQFIEDEITDLNVPTIMEADLTDGVKTLFVVLPNFKLLLQKADIVILSKAPGSSVNVNYDDFVKYPSLVLERLDEEQYLLSAINNEQFVKMMEYFSQPLKPVIQNRLPKEVQPSVPTITNEEPESQLSINDKIHRKWWQFWRE